MVWCVWRILRRAIFDKDCLKLVRYRTRRTCAGRCPVQSSALLVADTLENIDKLNQFTERFNFNTLFNKQINKQTEAVLQTGILPAQERRSRSFCEAKIRLLQSQNIFRQPVD